MWNARAGSTLGRRSVDAHDHDPAGGAMATVTCAPVPVPLETKSWMRIPVAPMGPTYCADAKLFVVCAPAPAPVVVTGHGYAPGGWSCRMSVAALPLQ